MISFEDCAFKLPGTLKFSRAFWGYAHPHPGLLEGTVSYARGRGQAAERRGPAEYGLERLIGRCVAGVCSGTSGGLPRRGGTPAAFKTAKFRGTTDWIGRDKPRQAQNAATGSQPVDGGAAVLGEVVEGECSASFAKGEFLSHARTREGRGIAKSLLYDVLLQNSFEDGLLQNDKTQNGLASPVRDCKPVMRGLFSDADAWLRSMEYALPLAVQRIRRSTWWCAVVSAENTVTAFSRPNTQRPRVHSRGPQRVPAKDTVLYSC